MFIGAAAQLAQAQRNTACARPTAQPTFLSAGPVACEKTCEQNTSAVSPRSTIKRAARWRGRTMYTAAPARRPIIRLDDAHPLTQTAKPAVGFGQAYSRGVDMGNKDPAV